MATYISRTPGSAGNRKKFTISMWVKRIKLGVDQWLVQAGASGSEFDIRFTTSDQIRFSTWDGSNGYGMITTRVFRDTSAWYHLVFQYDTAQATDTNRNKIYVNGTQIDPSDTSAYNAGKHPPQNYDNPSWNNTAEFRINDVTWTSSSAKDAVYTHIHHTDGYAYDASTFGSTDATTGEWKIDTNPSVTYGTNGFFIFKDSASTTDQSGNSLSFTTSGTLTKTEDNPSNVFNVWNRNYLTRHNSDNGSVPGFLQNGNTTFNSATNANYGYKAGTIGVTKGKFYWECKVIDNGRFYTGICYPNIVQGINTPWYDSTTYSAAAFNNNGTFTGRFISGSTYDEFATGTSISNNDIVGFALDMDNKALYAHKNGTYFAVGGVTGVPTSGSSRTGSLIEGFTGTRDDYLNTDIVSPFVGDPSSSGTHHSHFNFGNGYFGSTQISSAGTNASGIGIFEYDVPAGYTALCTKGLNE